MKTFHLRTLALAMAAGCLRQAVAVQETAGAVPGVPEPMKPKPVVAPAATLPL